MLLDLPDMAFVTSSSATGKGHHLGFQSCLVQVSPPLGGLSKAPRPRSRGWVTTWHWKFTPRCAGVGMKVAENMRRRAFRRPSCDTVSARECKCRERLGRAHPLRCKDQWRLPNTIVTVSHRESCRLRVAGSLGQRKHPETAARKHPLVRLRRSKARRRGARL